MHVPALSELLQGYSSEILQQAEIQLKYDVYIEKEKELVQEWGNLNHWRSLATLIMTE